MSAQTYQWGRNNNTRFEDMLCYAWYLFIDNKDEVVRTEATFFRDQIILASRLANLSDKPSNLISNEDMSHLRKYLSNFIPGQDPRKISLYLLKLIHILDSHDLVELNLIDVAGVL